MSATCTHAQIQTWRTADGEPVLLWSCVDCHRKFVPLELPPAAPQDVLYNELLMAVARKYPGETRHQTALRFIEKAQAPQISAAKESR